MARADLKYIIGFETNDTPVVQATKKLRQLTGQQKELDRALKDGLISQSIFRKGQTQLNDEIGRLRTATAQGGKALDQYIDKLDQGGKAMRRKELAAQQAGYQLQDFIVQIQAGQNPVIAFTQQFSQLAGFFAGPWGAAIGLGIAVLGGLVTALHGAYSAAGSTETKILSLKDAIKGLREETMSTADEVALMFSGLSEGSFNAKRSLDAALLELSQKTEGRVNATNFMDVPLGQRSLYRDEIQNARKLKAELDTAAATERGRLKVKRQLAEQERANSKIASDAVAVLDKLRADEEAAAQEAEKRRLDNEKWLAAQNEAIRLGNQTIGLEGRALLVAKQKVEQQKLFAELHKRGLDATKGEGLVLANNLAKQQAGVRAAYDANEAKNKALELERKRLAEAKKLTEYEKMIKSLSNNIGNSMSEAFMGMVDGTKSVKQAFRSMAADIVKHLFKVLVVQRLIQGIGGALSGSSNALIADIGGGLSSYGGGAANGGPVQAGRSYTVGERGPEIFTPATAGNITPNSQMGGSGVTIVQNINVSTGVQQTVRAEIRSMMPQIAESAKSAVADAKRRGGNYGKAFA